MLHLPTTRRRAARAADARAEALIAARVAARYRTPDDSTETTGPDAEPDGGPRDTPPAAAARPATATRLVLLTADPRADHGADYCAACRTAPTEAAA